MKNEEIMLQPRLTPESSQSYARSMPDNVEIQDHSSGSDHSSPKSPQRDGSTPEAVLKELLAKGDKTYKEQVEKIQRENEEAAKGVTSDTTEKATENASEETDTTDTASTPKDIVDTKAAISEGSAKSSLFGAIINAVKGTLTDEKLVKRVDTFTKSYDTLKSANLNDLKEEYQSWTPPTDKNDPQKVVYLVVQKYIAQIVEDKGEVPLSVFLQAANADREIQTSDVLAASTEGASTGVEKAVQRLMVAMDEKPVEEWSAKDLAEELVEFKKAVDTTPGSSDLDKQIEQVVEDFVVDKVEEIGVGKEAFAKVVTQVEEEKEDEIVSHVPENIVESTPSEADKKEDEVVEIKLAVPHDTVHSFTKEDSIPLPEKLSYGNDPELARAMWRAFNRGKALTSEQQVLASRGYMPMLMGGSGGAKEEAEATVPKAVDGTTVPIRREPVRADEEVEEDEQSQTAIRSRQYETREEAIIEENDVNNEDDPLTDLDVDGTKAKIGKDWGDLEAFFKTKASGSLSLLLDKAKSHPGGPEQIASYFNAKRAEALSLKESGKLEEAQKIAETLVDQFNQEYLALSNERRVRRLPEGKFNALKDGDRFDWVERNKMGYFNPTSMNELAYVIGLEEQQFATGGERQLLDEKGNFYEENFMYWVQDKFLVWHNNDPDSPQRFFDLIKVENQEMNRDVSVNTLVNGKDKYLKIKQVDEKKSIRNPKAGIKYADGSVEPEWSKIEYKYVPLDGLHAYLTDFVWLVGAIRNTSAEYIAQMSDDNKIGELIAAVMKSNVLTKRSAGKENTMEAVATLTSNFRDWGNIPRLINEVGVVPSLGRMLNQNDIILSEEIRLRLKSDYERTKDPAKLAEYERVERETKAYFAGVEKIKAKEQNIDVGDGVAVAYLMYYNIADYDYLYKKFGKETPTHLFRKEGMDAVLNKLAKISPSDTEDEKTVKLGDYLSRAALIDPIQGKNPHEIKALIDKWFYGEKGMFDDKGNVKDRKGFIDLLNIFVPPQKNANQTDMANKLIQLVVGERLALHDEKLQKMSEKERLDNIMGNAYNEFAMLIAQFMTPYTGAAAKGDTGVNAVNAAAKMRWIDFYKQKAGENTRAGGFGNLYNLGTIRSSYVDMMIGMPTVNGKSIIEVFEEKEEALRTNAGFDTRNNISRQLLFNNNDAKQYGAAHTGNAIKLFHQEMEGKEIDFHKFVHVDPITGHVAYKPDAMLDALQDAIIKPTRYAWSTNRVPFHKMVRIMEDNKKTPPIFRTGTQLEEMFKPDVLRVIEKTFINGNKNNDKFIEKFGKPLPFLTKDGRVKRYAVNSSGKFIDKNGKEITIDLKDKSNAWRNNLVLDMTEDGKLDPLMESMWKETDFRRCVVKGYLIRRFAGQLYGHTTTHSPYEYLDYGLREDIIRGLMTLPVDPDDHDGTLEGRHIGGSYFTKDDIKLLRNISKNQLWRNIPLALGADLRNGLFSAFREYFSRIWKASTAGI